MKIPSFIPWLVLVLLLAFTLRGEYLDKPFMGDELPGWVQPSKNLAETGRLFYSAEVEGERLGGIVDDSKNVVLHPPLGYYVYAVFHKLSPPLSVEAAQRLAPFLFTGGVFALLFLTGRLLFDTRVGFLAAFIGAVSTYSIFHGTFRVDVDGAFVTFFTLAAFYAYARWLKNSERVGLYAAGLFLGLGLLTRLSAAAFPLFFAAYELCRSRKASALVPLLVVPGLLFAGWAAAETIAGNAAYVNAVVGYNVPVKEQITLTSFFADKAVGLFSFARDLSLPLAGLLVLAFAALKPAFFKRQWLKPEGLLALLVLFTFVLAILPYRGEKQRYFTVALPFIFLLAGWLLSKYDLKNKIMLASFAAFAALFAVFKPHDHLLWAYELTGNVFPLVALALPLVLLAAAWKHRPQAVSALFGAYLAFSTVFVALGFSNLLAYSNGTAAGLAEKNVLIAGRNEAVKEVFFYDWLENRRLDWNNTYRVLNTTQQMQDFRAAHPNCRTVENHGYPIVFVCPK